MRYFTRTSGRDLRRMKRAHIVRAILRKQKNDRALPAAGTAAEGGSK